MRLDEEPPVILGVVFLNVILGFVQKDKAEGALFRTDELPPKWWPLILLSFFPSLIVVEIDKAISSLSARRG